MAIREIKSKKRQSTGAQFSYCPKPENLKKEWHWTDCAGCEHYEETKENATSYEVMCNFPVPFALKQFDPPKAVDKLVYRVEGQPNQSLDRNTIHLANRHTYLEPKLDGVRAFIHITPDGVFITTRRKDKFGIYGMMGDNFPQITQDPTLIEYGQKEGYTVIDSEVMMPVDTNTLKETMSIVGASPGKAVARQKTRGWAVFHAFDMHYNGSRKDGDDGDLSKCDLGTRTTNLRNRIFGWGNPYLKQVPHKIGAQPQDRRDIEDFYLALGHEGAIAKDPSMGYFEKRAWLKYKQRVTFEAQIMGYEHGTVGGKWEHGVGALIAGVYDVQGMLRQVCTFNPGDDEVRHEWMETLRGMDKDAILREQFIVELEAQTWTEDFSVRHPRVVKYRPDKNEPDTIDLTEQVTT